MKKLGSCLLIAGFVVGLSACGGGGGGSSSSDEGSSSSGGGSASQIFKENCATCHGENLQGKNGPNLQHIGKKMSKGDILKQIKNGGGGMPANVVKGDKAEKVASWLADKK